MHNSRQAELASNIEQFPSFSEILSNTAERSPDQIFLIEGENRWNYGMFNSLVNRCCHYFDNAGLQAGDIISVILRNSVDYLILYFAAIRSRIILNPFPFHLNAEEVISKVEIIEPKIIFCHKSHYEALSNSKFRTENLDNEKSKAFHEVLSDYPADTFRSPEMEGDQTAVMYYSSGTTGNPKIIEYTHRSMVLSQASMLRSGFTKPGDIHLCILPLGHTAVLRYSIKQCVCTASTVVLYESFWKLRTNLWNEIEKHGATFIEVVPSILIAILNTPYKDFNKAQAKSIDFIGCGSSFLASNLQEAFEKRFGVPVANLYGLSETGATHFDNPDEQGRKTGNIGRPFDIVDVKLFDDKGSEVGNHETGEFGIKGPGLFKGYYKNREASDKCFKNGYFMTGDLGRIDENGIFYYVDRIKDLIIKGGVNIVPSQIEEVLQSHSVVQEAAVIGKPDMLLGETIKCYIVPKNGEILDSKELKTYCKKKLGDFKTPSEFEVVEALPKGSSGKILKRELRNY